MQHKFSEAIIFDASTV